MLGADALHERCVEVAKQNVDKKDEMITNLQAEVASAPRLPACLYTCLLARLPACVRACIAAFLHACVMTTQRWTFPCIGSSIPSEVTPLNG